MARLSIHLFPLSLCLCRLLITCSDLLIFDEKLSSTKSILPGLQPQTRTSKLELGQTCVGFPSETLIRAST